MRCRCVVVPRSEGEFIRKKLSEEGVRRTDLRIASDDKNLYIPIQDDAQVDLPTREMDMEESVLTENYRDLLDLPDPLGELLPTSLDVIGDIYVMKFADELLPHSAEIGSAVLSAHKGAKVVALDRGVQGEFRIRKLDVIAGEERTTTVHKEFGLMFEMDISKVYFSPRLATERKRIADLVSPGERIIDMFAGVGPFSILIASNSEADIIYAIDKNPEAINYLIRNIKINKIKSTAPMLGDARVLVRSLKKADRIIMNLPHSSLDFLDAGLSAVEPGGMIHLYAIAGKDGLETVKESIIKVASPESNISVRNVQEVHTYSPTEGVYCFDLVI